MDEESSENDDIVEEEKVEVKEKPKITLNLKMNMKKEESSEKSDKPSQVIPKLELKKAREIQSLIIKKINND